MLLFAHFNKNETICRDDKALWSALQHGQREALSELFQRHHKHLYNYGIKMISNAEVVNEAIQELFLTLWNSHRSISKAHSVKAYLLSSLRRLMLKQLKQDKSRAERNWVYNEDFGEEKAFPVENLLIRREANQQKREQLQKGLEALTHRQKEAIFLKYYNGLTNKELVEVMGINYQCVRNLLHEAVKRLRVSVQTASIPE